jgi:hypothetical protein
VTIRRRAETQKGPAPIARRAVALVGALSLVASLALAACGTGGTSTATPVASAVATPAGTAALARVGTFTATAAMATRYYHTATLLHDGRVLIVGGCCTSSLVAPSVPLNTAELYDPKTGKSTPAGSMASGRMYQTATLLTDGRVLIAGGENENGTLASTEIYDPATNRFTAGALMGYARYSQTATLLQDGRVLMTGGATGLSSAEIYDPTKVKWAPAGLNAVPASASPSPGATPTAKPSGYMNSWRSGQTATLLPDGRVLIVGGQTLPQSADIYDPKIDRFTPTGYTNVDRFNHTATLLPPPDGRVLIVGGSTEPGSAETYDYRTGEFTPTGFLIGSRTNQIATLLSDGRVLIVGGFPSDTSGEVYNPKTGIFNRTNLMTTPRTSCTATLLEDGSVLIDGGVGVYGGTQVAEIYKS